MVATKVLLRDLDLAVPVATGGRRLEIVADGLPLFGGVQLAVDATLITKSREFNPAVVCMNQPQQH